MPTVPTDLCKFGAGDGCLLFATLADSVVTVLSAVTGEVVAEHDAPGATDFFFDSLWMVLVASGRADLVCLGGTEPTHVCTAASLHTVCFAGRYIVLLERDHACWVADTMAPRASIIAARFEIDVVRKQAAMAPGFKRYVDTRLRKSPLTTHAARAAFGAAAKHHCVLLHGPAAAHGHRVVYSTCIGATRNMCLVYIDPSALLASAPAVERVDLAWPASLYNMWPVPGTATALVDPAGTLHIMFEAADVATEETKQTLTVRTADGRQKTSLMAAQCFAFSVSSEHGVRVLKADGTYFTHAPPLA